MISRKPIALAACAAWFAVACGQQATPARPTAPASPPAAPTTSSRAADLRTRLDLLLGEHLMLAAKATAAATAGNSEQSSAYAGQLAGNGAELGDLLGAASGGQARSQFEQSWNAQGSALVAYASATAKNDWPRKQQALRSLTGEDLARLTALLAGLSGESPDALHGMFEEHIAQCRAIVDDQAARNYAQEYRDIDTAYQHMQEIGDTLAPAIVSRTGKFEGDVGGKPAGLRATLNALLQEHMYVATAATAATLAGRPDESAAASALLGQSRARLADAVGQLFGQRSEEQFGAISRARDDLLLADARAVAGNDAATGQRVRDALAGQGVTRLASFWSSATGLPEDGLATMIGGQVQAILQVVDDQGTRNYGQAAQDDAVAADRMQLLADPLAAAIVARLPQRFV